MLLPRTAIYLGLSAAALMVCGCQGDDASNVQGLTVANEATAPAPNAANAAAPLSQFAGMDANSDGIVVANEHLDAAIAMFDRMDADSNDIVTAKEMDAAQAALGGSPALSSAAKIKAVDTNKDGRLSRAEHVEGAKSMFGRMDTDFSATVSKAEFDAAHKAMLGR